MRIPGKKRSIFTGIITLSIIALYPEGEITIRASTSENTEKIEALSRDIFALEQSTQTSFGNSQSKQFTHRLSLMLSAPVNLMLTQATSSENKLITQPETMLFLTHLAKHETIKDLTLEVFNEDLALPDHIDQEAVDSITQQFLEADERHQEQLFELSVKLANLITITYQDTNSIKRASKHKNIAFSLREAIRDFFMRTLPNYLWEFTTVNEVAISYGCALVLPYLMKHVHQLSPVTSLALWVGSGALVYTTRERILRTKMLKICYTAILVGAAAAYYQQFHRQGVSSNVFRFDYPV